MRIKTKALRRLIAYNKDPNAPNSSGEGGDDAPVSRKDFNRFGEQIVDVLAKFEHSLTQNRNQPAPPKGAPAKPAPKPTPAPAPQPDGQQVVDALLRGDLGPLLSAVQSASGTPQLDPELRERLDQLTQFAQLQVSEQIPQNESHFRQQIDSKYGAGAYDKLFKADVDAKFADQPALRANRSYYQNVVNLVKGEKADDLFTHQTEAAKAEAEKAKNEADANQNPTYPFMLGGGVPISMRDGKPQFDADDEAWIAKFENANGEKFDREMAQKVLAATMKSTRGQPLVTASLDDLDTIFPSEENS